MHTMYHILWRKYIYISMFLKNNFEQEIFLYPDFQKYLISKKISNIKESRELF